MISLPVVVLGQNPTPSPKLISNNENNNQSRTLTLKESLLIAGERDIRLILSQERITQAIARIGQNRSSLLPQLEISSSQKRQTRDLRVSGINLPGDPLVGPFNTFDLRAQLTQMIFDPSAMDRLKSAQGTRELSKAQSRKTKEDVLAMVAQMYINARRSQENLEYAMTYVRKEEKNLSLAQSRLDSGTGSVLELKKAQAEHDVAIHREKQAEANAVMTRLDLLSALGMDLK